MKQDTIALPLAAALAAALEEELNAEDTPVAQAGVMAGATVSLEGCSCTDGEGNGMAWARVRTIFPSSNFPEPDTGVRSSGLKAVVLEAGVARCVPALVGTQYESPTMLGQAVATDLQLADMQVIERVICSVFTELDRDFVLGIYEPVGPEGSCVGGAWSVTVEGGWA